MQQGIAYSDPLVSTFYPFEAVTEPEVALSGSKNRQNQLNKIIKKNSLTSTNTYFIFFQT